MQISNNPSSFFKTKPILLRHINTVAHEDTKEFLPSSGPQGDHKVLQNQQTLMWMPSQITHWEIQDNTFVKTHFLPRQAFKAISKMTIFCEL